MKHAWIGLALVMGLAGCKQTPPAAPEEAAAPAVSEQAVHAAAEFPAVLQASGTEPFWGVLVDGGRLTYTTPETMDKPRMFEGTHEVKDGVLTVKGGEGDAAFGLTIRKGECSDGMSDLRYPFTSEFVLGKETFKGCARDPSVRVEAP
ncbi:hypothetical protein [Stenotrophomonas sp. SY1]|uniref:COG3650 family protein n=1 Tax=Stenotrophomonas sp. SY1 TaxID=477235 RepID=UPI001E3A1849|nr:hypothetical protein [Stenotrophomonas sp. SY1]MCD9087918.1 hypothetical protein [Stenotrophomonas sp. SY1]